MYQNVCLECGSIIPVLKWFNLVEMYYCTANRLDTLFSTQVSL